MTARYFEAGLPKPCTLEIVSLPVLYPVKGAGKMFVTTAVGAEERAAMTGETPPLGLVTAGG